MTGTDATHTTLLCTTECPAFRRTRTLPRPESGRSESCAIHEVIADIDAEAAVIALAIHWIGSVHREMRLPRRRRGQRKSASADVIAGLCHCSRSSFRRADAHQ